MNILVLGNECSGRKERLDLLVYHVSGIALVLSLGTLGSSIIGFTIPQYLIRF